MNQKVLLQNVYFSVGNMVLFCLYVFIYINGDVLWVPFWLRYLMGMCREEIGKIGTRLLRKLLLARSMFNYVINDYLKIKQHEGNYMRALYCPKFWYLRLKLRCRVIKVLYFSSTNIRIDGQVSLSVSLTFFIGSHENAYFTW